MRYDPCCGPKKPDCVGTTVGQPVGPPDSDDVPILFDPTTDCLWLWDCNTDEWVEFCGGDSTPSCIITGTGEPTEPPADGTQPIVYDPDEGCLYMWDCSTNAWVSFCNCCDPDVPDIVELDAQSINACSSFTSKDGSAVNIDDRYIDTHKAGDWAAPSLQSWVITNPSTTDRALVNVSANIRMVVVRHNLTDSGTPNDGRALTLNATVMIGRESHVVNAHPGPAVPGIRMPWQSASDISYGQSSIPLAHQALMTYPQSWPTNYNYDRGGAVAHNLTFRVVLDPGETYIMSQRAIVGLAPDISGVIQMWFMYKANYQMNVIRE